MDIGKNLSVTKSELCDFFVNYHGFSEFFRLSGSDAVTQIFERLRSVQFDPLNVVGRNAELTLFARNANMTRGDLYDALYKMRRLVDGWDKMMCIYRTEDFPKFKFLRDEATKQYSTVMSWRGQDECHNYTDEVYQYIKAHGATLVTDIPSAKTNSCGWGSAKVAGVCCEYLWNSGRLAVADKKGVVKSFDLTERLIGMSADDNAFSDADEFLRWYVKRRLASVGAARLQNGGAWLGVFLENADLREKVINELVARGEVIAVTVTDIKGKNNVYYINRGDEKYFAPAERDRAVFVPPLDNLIWDRKTVKSVFDFDYSWEVYTPPARRKFGYYVLPILIGNRFVGRIEPTVDKSSSTLFVKNVWFESGYAPSAEDIDMIVAEAERLAGFLHVAPDTELKNKPELAVK